MGAEYGEFNNGRVYPGSYRYYQNGNLVWDLRPEVYTATEGTLRKFHTKNIRQPISGTSTPWIPPSDYTNSKFSTHRTPCSRSITSGSDQLIWESAVDLGFRSNLFSGASNARMEANGNMQARAITECLNKLQDGKAGLGEDAATAHQALNLMADTGIILFKGLRALKHGDWGAAKRLLGSPTKSAANAWLAYIYGWKPLMEDIHGAYQVLVNLTPKAKLIHARRRISEDIATGEFRVYSGGNNIYHKSNEKSAVCTVSCHIVAQVNNGVTYDAGRLGLINPVAVAWELVPFSFLIDWCLPVGNVLTAFDAFAGLDFVGGYVSQRGVGSFTAEEDYSESAWKGNPAKADGYHFCYERAALKTAPFPSFYVKNPLSAIHGANALALLRSLIG